MRLASNISLFEGGIPPHLEQELDRLYGSLFSSSSYFKSAADLSKINTYVAQDQHGIVAIFLFTIENKTIRVVNEGMQLKAGDITEFANFAFAKYPDASMMAFHAVQIDGEEIPYFQQGFFCTEDFVADLPESPEAYMSELGSSTKKTIKWSKNRVERIFPSFSFQVIEGQDVKDDDIRALVKMKEARMSKKDKHSHIDENKEQTILRLLRECGSLGTITIDGKLCAGTTGFRVGDSVYSWLNSHDPAYDSYRLGMLCNFLSVCAFIERGVRRFHFGHTKYEYKMALLGKFQPYEHLVLYRSQLHFLRNVPHALNVAADGYGLMLRHKVLEGVESAPGRHWDVARKGLNIWRNIKGKRIQGKRSGGISTGNVPKMSD